MLLIMKCLYKMQLIDGKAMMLLNSETLMKYMQLKLGPALKICNIINKFKTKSNSKSSSANGNGGSNGV